MGIHPPHTMANDAFVATVAKHRSAFLCGSDPSPGVNKEPHQCFPYRSSSILCAKGSTSAIPSSSRSGFLAGSSFFWDTGNRRWPFRFAFSFPTSSSTRRRSSAGNLSISTESCLFTASSLITVVSTSQIYAVLMVGRRAQIHQHSIPHVVICDTRKKSLR